ncbi:hypothetical protein DAPK24_046090 [Pichia kluyveri]|uniref:Uncharacterized protein n=1 Tax=Pichia kluyveri TaxID=36015 RepID=A0AAV5RBL4_PICKL|nr:hypothetical protein DAPK24_046090 [Pichia kluyveri]
MIRIQQFKRLASINKSNKLLRNGFRRTIIAGPTKTGSPNNILNKNTNGGSGDNKSSKSSSPLDSSFSFQLFLIVGAMGAGYTLGKTTILTSPPDTLFPNGSITPKNVLVGYEKEDKERENKQYDMFKRCALRILENKGVKVDVKYGENESLYDCEFCNSHIADVMNDDENMSQVFFGKDPKSWEGKVFVWYPETTQDVSNIMQNCSEFKIPIYVGDITSSNNNYITFQMNFSKFKKENDSSKYMDAFALTFTMTNDEIRETFKKHAVPYKLNNNLSPVDLFMMGCGIRTNNSDTKIIANKFDINDISGFECVLPDGNILNVYNDSQSTENSNKLFHTLSRFQNQLCIITKVIIKKNIKENNGENMSLICVGSNDLAELRETLSAVRKRVPGVDISIIDHVTNSGNSVQDTISTKYGSFSTFAVMKLNDGDFNRIKNISNIMKIPIAEQEIPLKNVLFSDKISSGGECVIVKGPDGQNKTYYKTFNLNSDQNTTDADTEKIEDALVRRLRLAVDPSRVLSQ